MEKLHRCPCCETEKEFTDIETLREHLKSRHNKTEKEIEIILNS